MKILIPYVPLIVIAVMFLLYVLIRRYITKKTQICEKAIEENSIIKKKEKLEEWKQKVKEYTECLKIVKKDEATRRYYYKYNIDDERYILSNEDLKYRKEIEAIKREAYRSETKLRRHAMSYLTILGTITTLGGKIVSDYEKCIEKVIDTFEKEQDKLMYKIRRFNKDRIVNHIKEIDAITVKEKAIARYKKEFRSESHVFDNMHAKHATMKHTITSLMRELKTM